MKRSEIEFIEPWAKAESDDNRHIPTIYWNTPPDIRSTLALPSLRPQSAEYYAVIPVELVLFKFTASEECGKEYI